MPLENLFLWNLLLIMQKIDESVQNARLSNANPVSRLLIILVLLAKNGLAIKMQKNADFVTKK